MHFLSIQQLPSLMWALNRIQSVNENPACLTHLNCSNDVKCTVTECRDLRHISHWIAINIVTPVFKSSHIQDLVQHDQSSFPTSLSHLHPMYIQYNNLTDSLRKIGEFSSAPEWVVTECATFAFTKCQPECCTLSRKCQLNGELFNEGSDRWAWAWTAAVIINSTC